MRLLLISNSTMAGQPYLEYPKSEIHRFLGNIPVEALFIPFAAVTFSYDEYEQKVGEKFNQIGHRIQSIHHSNNLVESVENAEAIVVGGGNTWQLVRKMHELSLFDPIRKKVVQGTPFIGWSAGSNIACPTLRTTNDMPIVDPLGFDTLNLVPFQINPHYLDAHPDGHAGETRQQRIEEFIEINRTTPVIGLREGSMLNIESGNMRLLGEKSAPLFRYSHDVVELEPGPDLSWLLQQ